MAPNITDLVIKGDIATSEPLICTKNGSYDKNKILETKDTNNNATQKTAQEPYKLRIVWRNVIIIAYSYIGLVYGHYILFFETWPPFIFAWTTGLMSAFGITAGTHRLWAHKAYKAKLPLRIFLMLLQTLAFQNCIYEWVRDHRVHHKFTDSDADPHNSKRGLFFSHVGWLMCKKHPDVFNKGKQIDMSDLESDKVVMWQKRNFAWFMPLVSFIGPTLFMSYVCGSTGWVAWNVTIARWSSTVNITWLLNSAAHKWGWKPYDKRISSTDTAFLGFICFGEGWHNYHHVFPWDYKTSELVNYGVNFTNAFIDFFAKIGWAYELRTVSEEMIRHRVLKTGDGTHPHSKTVTKEELKEQFIDYVNKYHERDTNPLWGWDDNDMDPAEKKYVTILNKKSM